MRIFDYMRFGIHTRVFQGVCVCKMRCTHLTSSKWEILEKIDHYKM